MLFINLGNPKQELWYNRVKAQLRVPVSIGIGGTIDLYTEVLPRAPGWMQKMGLEWLFRCIQEPRRLGGRYLKDLCLFPLLILPALVYHNLNKLGVKIPLYRSAPRPPTASRLFISATQTVSFSSLSAMDDHESLQTFKESLEDIFSQDGIVLDFDSVDHISLEGLALLVEISQRAWKEKKPLYFLNFKARLKLLAKVHRLDDVFSVHLCSSAEDLLKQFQQAGFGSTFYDSIQQGHQSIIISFFGQIDDQVDQKEYLRKLAPMMEKNCLVDLRYCTYIDQAGQGLLLNIQKKQKTQGRTFKLQHIPSSIKHKLMHTGIYDKLI